MAEHVKGCEDCAQKLNRWKVSSHALDALVTRPYRPVVSSPPGDGQVPEVPSGFDANITTQATGERSSIPERPRPVEQGPPRLPRVSGYVILGVLGRGGMGVVYQARHLKLNRLVALKMILSGSYAGPEELVRFHAEAEAVARLQHPNIVQIFDVGEHAETDGPTHPFMALEYVEGGTLARKAGASPLAARDAAGIVEVLARAMHYAHQRGIVHRDLKPANVLLAADGTPKITDFGLAKHLETPSGQTQTGQVMGTPEYMAPEQAAGQVRAIGPATDGYALGAILYALVTGRPPFRGVTVLDTLEQVRQREPVPPGQLQPKLPRDLGTICLKCLQKEPAKRYASTEELADDLQRFLNDEPIRARPIGRLERMGRWCRRYPLVASLLVLLGLAFVGAVWGWADAVTQRDEKDRESRIAQDNEEKEKAQRVKTEEALTEVEKQKHEANTQTILANLNAGKEKIAADKERQAREKLERTLAHRGVLLAGQYEFNNNTSLAEQILDECPTELRGWEWRYLKRLCGGNVRVLRGHENGVPALAFSADGRRLASASLDRIVRVWDVRGGKELYASPKYGPATLGMFIPTIALSRDGRLLSVPIPYTGPKFTPDWNVAILRDLMAGKDLPALKAPTATLVTRVTFSPDGKQIAGACESFQARLRLWDAATSREIKPLPGNARKVEYLAFSPDSKLLATIGTENTNKGELKIWDLAQGKDTFTFTADTFDLLTAVAFSSDGKYLATCITTMLPQKKGILKIWDTANWKELDKLPVPTGPVTAFAFSPDSRLLAANFGDGKIKAFDLKSGAVVLAVTGWVDGGGHAAYQQLLNFSPDSKRLALAGFYHVQVWDLPTKAQILDLRGHTSQVLAVAFSPDGQYLASGAADHTVRLWDLKAAQRPRALRDGNNVFDHVAVSPDGEVIATAGHAPTGIITGQIKLWKTATGELLRALAGHKDGIKGLVFSPDG
ncbi:MAG TPA: protein kinase, partial [Gemmataceae bacterium]|nr:protein kinase [Gemmataceae bacterium]